MIRRVASFDRDGTDIVVANSVSYGDDVRDRIASEEANLFNYIDIKKCDVYE